MHVWTRSTHGLARLHFPGCALESAARTQFPPSLFSHSFVDCFSTWLIARHRSAYRFLSSTPRCMYIYTHLKDRPLFRAPLALHPLFVSLNSEETLGCSRRLFGTKWLRVTDFDRNTRHGPDFNVLTPSAPDRSGELLDRPSSSYLCYN